MKNDPKRIKAMVNKTVKHLDKMMKEVMDLKSPTMKKYIKMIQKDLNSFNFKDMSSLSIWWRRI